MFYGIHVSWNAPLSVWSWISNSTLPKVHPFFHSSPKRAKLQGFKNVHAPVFGPAVTSFSCHQDEGVLLHCRVTSLPRVGEVFHSPSLMLLHPRMWIMNPVPTGSRGPDVLSGLLLPFPPSFPLHPRMWIMNPVPTGSRGPDVLSGLLLPSSPPSLTPHPFMWIMNEGTGTNYAK